MLFCISILLAKTATATVGAADLQLAKIPGHTTSSGQTDAKTALASFGSAERALLGNSHTATLSLSSLPMLAVSREWSAVFPVIGVIAAVAVTQLLRRRRIAQLRSISSAGQ